MAAHYAIQRSQLGELWALHIRCGRAQAWVLEQGAQVMHYQLDGQAPVIWSNPAVQWRCGVPVRGGIPVCWPWFGEPGWNPPVVYRQIADADAAPLHGLARQQPWELVSHGIMDGAVVLEWSLIQGPSIHWPCNAELTLRMVIGEYLDLQLRTRNTSKHALAISQALHTYFAVSDVTQTRVTGLAGLQYQDCLDGWHLRRQHEEPDVREPINRLYRQAPARMVVEDPGWHRKILIDTHASASAVLWNPGAERARSIDQFAPDTWRHMLCLETARLGTDCQWITPGKEVQMGVRIQPCAEVFAGPCAHRQLHASMPG